MFTLSDASVLAKKFMKYGLIFLVFIIIGYIIFNLAIYSKNSIFKSSTPKANTAFGKLPSQMFPSGVPEDNFTYNVNTVSGNLPSFPEIINVYKLQPNLPDLLAADKMDQKVANIGFKSGYNAISNNTYEWTTDSGNGIIKSLKANIITGDFTITSNYMQDSGVLSAANLPTQTQAQAKAAELIESMNLPTNDLDLENSKTYLYAISNNSLVAASSLSYTKAIEVNIFQKNVNDMPIYYEKPNKANINILIAGGDRTQVVSANYIHQIPTENYATYPIKTTDQAFNELKNGNAYIAYYTGSTNNIVINDVTLAYYVGTQPQDFLMPIYVFSGNDNFYAYVPAVTDEWISK